MTGPATKMLYRTIRIHRRKDVIKLARKLVRHHLENTVNKTLRGITWIPLVEVVLRACVGLKTLHIESVNEVPHAAFEYPSLKASDVEYDQVNLH